MSRRTLFLIFALFIITLVLLMMALYQPQAPKALPITTVKEPVAQTILSFGNPVIATSSSISTLNYSLPVNKDGFIVIPNVGRVDLNGLTLAEAKNKIIYKLADTYNFHIDVNNPGAGKASASLGKWRNAPYKRPSAEWACCKASNE